MASDILALLEKEGLHLASIKARTLAMTIDELLITGLVLAGCWDTIVTMKDTLELITYLNTLVMWIIGLKILYHTFFVAVYGATIGKIAMKIEIVRSDDLSKPDTVTALKRSIVRIFSESLFYLGFLWGILDPVRQTWHDKLGQTLVINR